MSNDQNYFRIRTAGNPERSTGTLFLIIVAAHTVINDMVLTTQMRVGLGHGTEFFMRFAYPKVPVILGYGSQSIICQ